MMMFDVCREKGCFAQSSVASLNSHKKPFLQKTYMDVGGEKEIPLPSPLRHQMHVIHEQQIYTPEN